MQTTKSRIGAAALIAAAVAGVNPSLSKGLPIAPRDLVVLRIGDGTSQLNSSAAPITVLDYAITYTGGQPTGAALVQSIAAPTTDSRSDHAIGQMGNSVIEGGMARSLDGNWMTFGGYHSSPCGPTDQFSATETGIVGILNVNTGTLDTSTNVSRNANADAWRGVATTNGVDLWIATSINGIKYTTAGTSDGSLPTAITANMNTRRVQPVKKANGDTVLYMSSQSGSRDGVSTLGSPPPTVGTITPTLLSGLPTLTQAESMYDFWFADDQTIYAAEEVNSTMTGIGLQKWISGDGGNTWTEAWNHAVTSPGTTADRGIRGLSGYRDGNGNDILFASTNSAGAAANYVVGLFVPAGDVNGLGVVDHVLVNTAGDFGGAAVGTYTLRGLVINDVPEPGTAVMLAMAGVGILLLRRKSWGYGNWQNQRAANLSRQTAR